MIGTHLAGGSYVVSPDELEYRETGGWREAPVAGREFGSRSLGLRVVEAAGGTSAWRVWRDAETVLFALAGSGELDIDGQRFELNAGTGAFVAPGESFRLRNEADDPLRVILAICPDAEPESGRQSRAPAVDRRARTVAAADRVRHPTGDRFYQLLVDERMGCRNVTQFIGGIPRSRAPAHYHEYEEAITILEGEGFMHTGERSAPVAAGSVIFLAHGQRHSLECTSASGMRLLGVFHPSGSPAVSYE